MLGADRSPASRKSSSSRQNGGPGQHDQESSWQYDGDSERQAPETDKNGQNSQMRWTKKQIRKGKQAMNTHLDLPPQSAFAIGDDEDDKSKSRPRSRASSAPRTPLPSDAVDLVVEDSEAIEEARMKERRKGEPQTKAPVHIYRHNNPGSPRDGKLEEVYEDDGYDGVQKRSDFLKEEEEPNVLPDEVLENIEAAPEGDTPWQSQTGQGGGRNGYSDEHNPWS